MLFNITMMLCAAVIIMSLVSKLKSYWKGTLHRETYCCGRVKMGCLLLSPLAKILTS